MYKRISINVCSEQEYVYYCCIIHMMSCMYVCQYVRRYVHVYICMYAGMYVLLLYVCI